MLERGYCMEAELSPNRACYVSIETRTEKRFIIRGISKREGSMFWTRTMPQTSERCTATCSQLGARTTGVGRKRLQRTTENVGFSICQNTLAQRGDRRYEYRGL